MKLRRSIIAVFSLTAFALALPAMADDQTVVEKTTTTTKHHYVYYGDHQIYFSPDTKTYYWQSNGNWTSGTALPAEDQAYIKTRGMEIDLDTDKPYTQNEVVIEKYKTRDGGGG
jgi:hypothetical protein